MKKYIANGHDSYFKFLTVEVEAESKEQAYGVVYDTTMMKYIINLYEKYDARPNVGSKGKTE